MAADNEQHHELPVFDSESFADATAFCSANPVAAAQADINNLRKLINLNTDEAKRLFKADDFEGATLHYTHALQMLDVHPAVAPHDADRVKILNNLGLSTRKQGRHEECIRFCEKV